MAEKEVKIKVTTEADMGQLDDLKNAVEDVKSSAEELGSTASENMNEVSEGAEETTGSVEGLDSSVDELNSNLDSVNGASLDETASSADELGNATDSAGSSAEQLGNGLDNVNSGGLDGASGSADELGSSLDNASNSANSLNDSLGIIESASFMGLAEGIGQYAAGAENLAQEMNTASISVGQLATQTGIAEPQMVSLINHISNATFPNEEAMMYVKSLDQIGVASQNLGKSATDLDKINDAFGLGATKVNSLGQELSVLGVDMNNVSSSFNALAYANANTVGGMENYYSFLKKYDAQFKELGYNVDQASVIIAGATQKFGGGRAALSGLSNALKEANGDSRKLEEALGLQAGAIDNASQLTGQYEGQLQKLADEEAEHKTILDQINAAWEDMSLALSPILSPLASFIGMVGQVGQTALAINSIVTLVQSLKGLPTLLSTVGGGFTSLFSILMANPIILVVVAVVALIAILVYLYYTNEDVRNAINGFIDVLSGVAEVIYSSVVGAIEWLSEAWQNLVTWFTDGANTISSTVTGAFQGLMDIWNTVVNLFNTYAPLIAQVLFIMATGGVGAIVLLIANFMGMPNQVGQALQNVINRVTSFVSNVVSRMRSAATNAVNGFVSGISQLAGKVYNELQRTLSRVMDWGSQIVSRLGSIAQQAWQAFVRGLGIGSPGYIQILTLNELANTAKRVPQVAQGIVSNLAKMASQAVDAWGTPSFQYGFENITKKDGVNIGNIEGNDNRNIIDLLNQLLDALNNKGDGEPTLIFNLYGDMDNEDRMQKFLEAVRRELNWNNATAGRTIDG